MAHDTTCDWLVKHTECSCGDPEPPDWQARALAAEAELERLREQLAQQLGSMERP